jgi:hypothetical protein
MGDLAAGFDGERLDGLWVNAVLAAAIEQRAVVEPHIVPLVDGWLDDIGDPVTVQTLDTDYGAGFDQLDAMRVTADADGVRVGIDGVFDSGNNALVVLFDVDYGEGTGLGGTGSALPDTDGSLEAILSTLVLDDDVPGLGFDLAIVSLRAREMELSNAEDDGGLRGLRDPWATDGDLWWLPATLAYDDGNVSAFGVAARDAGATGATEGGFEALLPWSSVWPDGLPTEGQTIAVLAAIVSTDGTYASNQALPPYSAPTPSAVSVQSVVTLTVDGDGVLTGAPAVGP